MRMSHRSAKAASVCPKALQVSVGDGGAQRRCRVGQRPTAEAVYEVLDVAEYVRL